MQICTDWILFCSPASQVILILFIHHCHHLSWLREKQCWLSRGHLATFPSRVCCGQKFDAKSFNSAELSLMRPSHVILAVSLLLIML